MKIILSLLIIIPMLFIVSNHPLSMNLLTIFQTIMISMFTGISMKSFWFSYILFLIMIGGMLILFMYMTSIASNEKFSFNSIFLLSLMFMMIMFLILIKLNPTYNLINQKDMSMLNDKLNFMIMNLKYFSLKNNFFMMSLIIYLLMILLMIAKITKYPMGPIRQKF